MKDFSDRDIILAFAKKFKLEAAEYDDTTHLPKKAKLNGATSTISLTLNGENLVDFHLDECHECVTVSGEQSDNDESLH